MALKVKIKRMYLFEGENIKAYLDVLVNAYGYEFGFNDMTLRTGKNGYFIGFANRPGKNEGEFHDFYYMNKKAKDEISRAVLDEFKRKIKAREKEREEAELVIDDKA